jgi:hypothetical protein
MDVYRWLKGQWDRACAVLSVIVGALALLVGWLGVSRSSLPAEQIPYLASGAVFGLFALGIGATLWLSADLRDEWRELDAIRRVLAERRDGDRPVPLELEVVGDTSPASPAARERRGRRPAPSRRAV